MLLIPYRGLPPDNETSGITVLLLEDLITFYDFAIGDPIIVLNINYSLPKIKSQVYLLFHFQVVDKVVLNPF